MTTLSIRAAARRLGIPAKTLRQWTAAGIGPMPDARGHYDGSAIDEWAKEMSRQLDGVEGVMAPWRSGWPN